VDYDATRIMAKMRLLIKKLRTYAPVVAALMLFTLLVACGTADPPSVVEIGATEVYPGATEVVTQEMQIAWRSPGIEQYRTVDFRTSDSPDVVLNYFRKTLLDRGWAISGCQGAEGSLTFSWVFPYSLAMEIIEVDTNTDSVANIRLTFARHFYKSGGIRGSESIPYNPIDVMKKAGLTNCIGVYTAKTDQTTFVGYVALALVVLVWLLHIRVLSSQWNNTRELLLSTVAMIFATAGVWLIIGFGSAIVSGVLHLSSRMYSQVIEDPLPMVVAQLVFRSPWLSAGIIVALTVFGVLMKEPVKRARLRLSKRSSEAQGRAS
jgi:hypothetical protein